MAQVNNISIQNNSQNADEQNRFYDCEEIVEELVEKGLPRAFTPDTFISKIAQNYGITSREARTCLKLAIKLLEAEKPQEEQEKQEEELYAQSGYFYPQGYTQRPSQNNSKKKDGMDSLSSLGSYNRLMFGLAK